MPMNPDDWRWRRATITDNGRQWDPLHLVGQSGVVMGKTQVGEKILYNVRLDISSIMVDIEDKYLEEELPLVIDNLLIADGHFEEVNEEG